ncbi:hypothetical protein CTA2_5640 [Colletotrichum tanaceti]|uniref:Rhodopsin domain-containing protein n=1 Tax=Colletotrichum tanaceti TaxID=1306861 RepID=A0A4U6X9A2_9PEZI|nr:hypothetical protein CTA2_5640 [Colletotrichum tanaceti]TKW51713.1 hypothetical protein CTA1_8868 [Colletotrichum tanaceti]
MPPPGLSAGIGIGTAPLLVLRSVTSDPAAADTSNAIPPWLGLLPRPQDPNERNGISVVPVAVLSAVVAVAFVCMRFYTRVRILRSVKWEDWIILASLAFAISTSAGMITQLEFGLGEHLYYAWPSFSSFIQTHIFTDIFYSVSITLTKISILLLYINVLTYDLARLLAKVLLAFVIVSHAWIVVSILTTCIPLQATWRWDPGNSPVYCHPPPVYWGNVCLHLATDFLIFLLPLPIFSSMRLPRRQKMGLCFVFCLAFLVCAISIIRLVRIFHRDQTPEQVMDVTWSAVSIANLTCVEVHAAIVTACLPTLKPLLCRFCPWFSIPNPGGRKGSSSSASSSTTHATARGDWEKNFSNGDAEAHYQRPLSIGTKRSRPQVQRDTFASLFDQPTADVEGRRDEEFRLAEIDSGAPVQWPPTMVRKSRLQVPQGAKTRGSTPRHEQDHPFVGRLAPPSFENRI